MVTHQVRPGPGTLRGYLTRDLPPILTIDSGDRVCYQTLDAAWGALEQTFPLTKAKEFSPRDRTRDVHHALCGPVAIRGAEPGMALEICFRRIRTGRWGWSAGPELPSQMDSRLGVPGGTSSPVSPEMTMFGTALTAVATTGRAAAMASTMAQGNPS